MRREYGDRSVTALSAKQLLALVTGCALAVVICQVRAPAASATTYPQVVEISQFGTIQGGLAPPGIPDWTPNRLTEPLASIAATRDQEGAWEVAKDGGVFAFGDAGYAGSLPGDRIGVDDIVGMATTPNGAGYWLVGSDGGVFGFGDASFLGSLPALKVTPAAPVVGMSATPDGNGYWLVGADGGVFAFGDARYEGSVPGLGVSPAASIIGIDAPDSGGYWLAGKDGGVFAFGDAPFLGSGRAPAPASVVSIISWPGAANYTLIQANELMSGFGPQGQPSTTIVACPAELIIIPNPGPSLTTVSGAVIGLAAPTPCSYP